jgi:carbon-monoxide dehydrogenase medium subunit
VLASPDVRRVQPLVSLALEHVAHATIRNRGTTVGSIVHADAAAEMPMVIALLGGSVDVASVSGTRTIPATDLFAGPLESTLHHDEIALGATFPALAPGEGVGFAELARRHGDYAVVGVGAVVAVEGHAVASARLGYLSVSDVPTVVDVTSSVVEEVALRPSRNHPGLSDAVTAAAAEHALQHLDPADDLHASAAYRSELVRVLTHRVLRAAYDDARARAGDAA